MLVKCQIAMKLAVIFMVLAPGALAQAAEKPWDETLAAARSALFLAAPVIGLSRIGAVSIITFRYNDPS